MRHLPLETARNSLGRWSPFGGRPNRSFGFAAGAALKEPASHAPQWPSSPSTHGPPSGPPASSPAAPHADAPAGRPQQTPQSAREKVCRRSAHSLPSPSHTTGVGSPRSSAAPPAPASCPRPAPASPERPAPALPDPPAAGPASHRGRATTPPLLPVPTLEPTAGSAPAAAPGPHPATETTSVETETSVVIPFP